MSTLANVYDTENIERAWKWVRSNPDATFKAHFRNAYTRYALGDTVLLADLQNRLQRGIYEPQESCKLYLPKRSGILRPCSLLSVEDQIVYQAFVNIIAEQLFPRIKSRYYVDTFGHLYAGKKSTWFYQKWSDGYSKFNEAARDAFRRGLTLSASFDLTACYDSLDHHVLRHFLLKIACSPELCDRITELLSTWTATEHQIFHGHGIPQGPLGSGLLSEVVLQHFDQHYGPQAKLKYLRYVDDIRLFATSEKDLRKMLIKLDMLSKDVGLFPQSSKITIHEVKDIDEELKSVSSPPEPAITPILVNQVKLRKRLIALSPRFEITNDTRFKYLLGRAEPHHTINARLLRICQTRPDLVGNITSYLQGYTKLPKTVGAWLIKQIAADQLYPAVLSRLIRLAEGRLNQTQSKRADLLVRRIWSPSLRPDVLSAVGSWVLSNGSLSPRQAEYALRKRKNWWPQCNLIDALDTDPYGKTKVTEILNAGIRDHSTDVALAAAAKLLDLGCVLKPPLRELNRRAGLLLRDVGFIRQAPRGQCGIDMSMTALLGTGVAGIDWKRIFGVDHRKAEVQAIWCKAYALTNVTAFVNAVDVFNDWLLIRLYAHDSALGTYTAGKVGSILTSKRLKTTYPALFSMVEDVHQRRYESHLSHAKVQRTGKPTSFIKFGYLKTAKRLMRAAFVELNRKW